MTLKYIGYLTFAAVFVISTVVGSVQSVYAIDDQCDYSFFESNGIYMYDPCTPNCSTTTSITTQLTGTTNEQKIYNFWVAQGLSPAQAAGVTGSLQAEGGFSAFRQETTETWPAGGYGIAQFTGGQRTAVTIGDPTNKLSSLGDTYTTYYTAAYGGAVGSSGVPDGVPTDVNDAFLLVELNYLSTYISEFIPSNYPERVTGLTSDYGITIQKDQKLLPFIKTLTTPDAAAEAWTYLYEFPADIKSTAATRAGLAEGIFSQSASSSQAATDCSGSIGTGGLSFDQANSLMIDYEKNGVSWFSAHGYKGELYTDGPVTTGYCTVLVAYFEDRFSKVLSPINDGSKTASDIVSGSGGAYTSGTSSSIKPYSVISFGTTGGPHTGIVLGVNGDGNIIVDEMYHGNVTGTQKMTVDYSSGGTNRAVGRVEQWSSIDAYIKAKSQAGYPVASIAIPSTTEISHINSQLSTYFGGEVN